MTRTGRPFALVTGASGGIGADLARELARDGHDLALVARGASAMQALAEELKRAGAQVHVVALDLGAPGAAAALVEAVRGIGREVDVLVNNAGFGDACPFHEADPARLDAMVALNVAALTSISRAFLPGMVARGRGRILNVASTAAFQPGPGMAVYCATKAYVLSLSEAIGHELRGTGVTVTALCPGPTETGFAKAAGAESNRLFSVGSVPRTTPAEVARVGYRAMMRGKRVEIVGAANAIGAISARFTPRPIVLALTEAMLGRRR